jgi:hypothetical protein
MGMATAPARDHKHTVHSHHPDVIIETVDAALEKTHGAADWSVAGMKAYSGKVAFREYSLLIQLPLKNTAGNFRGMVVNKRARVIYDFTVDAGEVLEKAGTVLFIAGVAIELSKRWGYVTKTINSSDDTSTKAQKLMLTGSTCILSGFASLAPTGTHLLAHAVAKASGVVHSVKPMSNKLNAADANVQSWYKSLTDVDKQVHYINTHMTF